MKCVRGENMLVGMLGHYLKLSKTFPITKLNKTNNNVNMIWHEWNAF